MSNSESQCNCDQALLLAQENNQLKKDLQKLFDIINEPFCNSSSKKKEVTLIMERYGSSLW